ncbi:MAG: hypothetical protein PHC51_12985 [bacterium]|nr:hypothetical protein [bacterium]
MDDNSPRVMEKIQQAIRGATSIELSGLPNEDLPNYDRLKAVHQLREGRPVALESTKNPAEEVDLLSELQMIRAATAVHYALDQHLNFPGPGYLAGYESFSWEWNSPLQRGIRAELQQQRQRHRSVLRSKLRAEQKRSTELRRQSRSRAKERVDMEVSNLNIRREEMRKKYMLRKPPKKTYIERFLSRIRSIFLP